MKFLRNSCARCSAAVSKTSLVAFTIIAIVPQIAAAQVVISEFMFDAPGSDSKSEWVELQNTGTDSIDISKWKINDGSNHVYNAPPKNGSTGSLIIDSGAFLILAADAGTFIGAHPEVSTSVIDTVIDLPNLGGKIMLLDASSTKVDSVSYTTSKGADGTGESLQKVNGKLVAAKPTPGA